MSCLRANSSFAVSIPGQCPFEKLLDPFGAEYSVTEGTGEAFRSICRFLFKVWSETSMGQTLANRYINGKTKSIPRTSVGLRSANSIQQGKAKRDNPGNVKQQ